MLEAMTPWPRRRDVVFALVAAVWPRRPAEAQKPQPAVIGRWERVPLTVSLGRRASVTLRVVAAEDAPQVTIRLVPTAGVAIVGWAGPRRAALKKGETLALPVAFRVVRDGTWTLGASVTNTQPGDEQVSGAVIAIVAGNGKARLTNQSRGPSALNPMDRT